MSISLQQVRLVLSEKVFVWLVTLDGADQDLCLSQVASDSR